MDLGGKQMRKSICLILAGVLLLLLVLASIGIAAGQPPDADDTDDDGLADSWEMKHFNTLDYEADFDPDNDGATNIEEFEGQTDPMDELDFPVTEEDKTNTQAMIAVGAGLALGIAGIASATGIGIAGASAVGVTAENPKLFAKTLLLQLLPMTQGIYALLVVFLLMVGVGLLGGGVDSSMMSNPAIGIAAIGIGLVTGFTGVSAIGQGITASASISAVGRNPAVFGRGLIFSAMSETLAIFGFLIAILFLVGFGFL
jgi:V/A-type H+-transporting ATPase subunit K